MMSMEFFLFIARLDASSKGKATKFSLSISISIDISNTLSTSRLMVRAAERGELDLEMKSFDCTGRLPTGSARMYPLMNC